MMMEQKGVVAKGKVVRTSGLEEKEVVRTSGQSPCFNLK